MPRPSPYHPPELHVTCFKEAPGIVLLQSLQVSYLLFPPQGFLSTFSTPSCHARILSHFAPHLVQVFHTQIPLPSPAVRGYTSLTANSLGVGLAGSMYVAPPLTPR